MMGMSAHVVNSSVFLAWTAVAVGKHQGPIPLQIGLAATRGLDENQGRGGVWPGANKAQPLGLQPGGAQRAT